MRIKKLLLVVILVFGFVVSGVATSSAATRSGALADSVIFHYRSGSILLYDTYKDNAAGLATLGQFVSANRNAIIEGSYHLALYGYIPTHEVGDKRAVNTASIQASVVRAYIKTYFGISHTCFTFDIDTTQNRSNQVQLQLVRTPIQAYANTSIYYSESRNLNNIAAAFAQYKNGVPYTSYYMVLAKRGALGMSSGSELYAIGDRSNKYSDNDDDEQYQDNNSITDTVAGYYIKAPDGSFISAPKDALATGVNVIYVRNADGFYAPASSQELLAFGPAGSGPTAGYGLYEKQGLVRTEPYAESKGSMAARDYPVVGIKTNLIYWLGSMPNAELEFFMGKGFSLAFEGGYAWLSQALGADKAYYIWGAGAEFRVWFKQNRRFDGFYAGIYGHAGQYDFKFNAVGNQGDYFGGGLTFGYVLPLGKSFNMEFGLGLGYINYTRQQYEWEPISRTNPPIGCETTRHYVGPTKLKVSLVWKF